MRMTTHHVAQDATVKKKRAWKKYVVALVLGGVPCALAAVFAIKDACDDTSKAVMYVEIGLAATLVLFAIVLMWFDIRKQLNHERSAHYIYFMIGHIAGIALLVGVEICVLKLTNALTCGLGIEVTQFVLIGATVVSEAAMLWYTYDP